MIVYQTRLDFTIKIVCCISVNTHFQEGRNDCSSTDNLHTFSVARIEFLNNARRYSYEGSLFVKIVIEVLEDASTN